MADLKTELTAKLQRIELAIAEAKADLIELAKRMNVDISSVNKERKSNIGSRRRKPI